MRLNEHVSTVSNKGFNLSHLTYLWFNLLEAAFARHVIYQHGWMAVSTRKGRHNECLRLDDLYVEKSFCCGIMITYKSVWLLFFWTYSVHNNKHHITVTGDTNSAYLKPAESHSSSNLLFSFNMCNCVNVSIRMRQIIIYGHNQQDVPWSMCEK